MNAYRLNAIHIVGDSDGHFGGDLWDAKFSSHSIIMHSEPPAFDAHIEDSPASHKAVGHQLYKIMALPSIILLG